MSEKEKGGKKGIKWKEDKEVNRISRKKGNKKLTKRIGKKEISKEEEKEGRKRMKNDRKRYQYEKVT